MTPLLEVTDASVTTPSGRPLFEGLSLRLSRERVALVGRNGSGKSTLLAVLAGRIDVQVGRVAAATPPHFVPQALIGPSDESSAEARGRASSHGELRRRALVEARASGAEILLLDEPSEDLDEDAVSWLRSWLNAWRGCLVIASHDRRLLAGFEHFLLVSESGSRYFHGTLSGLEVELEREHYEAERRYASNLVRLAAYEAHMLHVARRKARKKRYGRCSELDRATSRKRLNQKRNAAQVSHGRLAKSREARLDALREWSKSTRRALEVHLPLELPVPALPEVEGDLLVLRDVSARVGDRYLFRSLDLRIARQRLGVIGPNGAGKTTLLEILSGDRAPATGSIARDLSRIGTIAQGGANWMLEETLLSYLSLHGKLRAVEDVAQHLVAHKFPLALAERPLRSLSPGERARAALICLFRRQPAVELLILDEPTYSLDLVGQRALTNALRAWPGGLIVASHDRAFLSGIATERYIELGP